MTFNLYKILLKTKLLWWLNLSIQDIVRLPTYRKPWSVELSKYLNISKNVFIKLKEKQSKKNGDLTRWSSLDSPHEDPSLYCSPIFASSSQIYRFVWPTTIICDPREDTLSSCFHFFSFTDISMIVDSAFYTISEISTGYS